VGENLRGYHPARELTHLKKKGSGGQTNAGKVASDPEEKNREDRGPRKCAATGRGDTKQKRLGRADLRENRKDKSSAKPWPSAFQQNKDSSTWIETHETKVGSRERL